MILRAPPNINGPMISNGTFTFSNAGTATNADFQTLLDSLEYRNAVSSASGVRMLEVIANDGVEDSLVATTTVNIVEVNDAPTLSGLGPNVSYTEDGVAVILDDNVILSDPELLAAGNYDGATLSIARVGHCLLYTSPSPRDRG